jgi:hypothetical protein
MTSIANFNIAQHLKVELFLPLDADNLFIIGISQIGGDDVLGSSVTFIIGESLIGSTDVLSNAELPGFEWQDFGFITVSAETSIGGRIQNSLYFQPEPATASIVLQSFQYDPAVNRSMRPGAKVRIRLDDGIVNETLFNGFIDTISTTYGADADGWNTVSIAATDVYKRIVNARVADYDTTGFHGGNHATPLEAITTAVEAAGYEISPDSVALNHKMPTEHRTDVIINDIINDAIQVGLGLTWVDQATEQLVVIPRPTIVTTAPEGTYTIGNNHGEPYHLCMSNIAMGADADTIFNSLRVSNKNDENEYVVKTDQDSIDLFGINALDVAINTTPDGQLTKWADEVFGQSPTKLIKNIQTPGVDNLGALTQAAFFTPGTLVGVSYTKAPLIVNDYYTVTKATQSITVDSWLTTLELWKEF